MATLSEAEAAHEFIRLLGVHQVTFLSIPLDINTSANCLEKHPKQGLQYKDCVEAPELGVQSRECFAFDCKHKGSCARN